MHDYQALLREILAEGGNHRDRTQVGTTSSFGNQTIYKMSEGFPILTTKYVPFTVVAQELFWFLTGSCNNQTLRYYKDARGNPVTIWDEWADEPHTEKFKRPVNQLGPIYGHQWRNYGASPKVVTTEHKEFDPVSGVNAETPTQICAPEWYCPTAQRYVGFGYYNDGLDQIKQLCEDLRNNPRSRRLIVSAWNPKEATSVELPPCHTLFQLKWHEESNQLDLKLYQRSADVFLGVPFNISSYALLLSLLAHTHGMIPGKFIHTFGDVHIYNTHREQVDLILSRTPKSRPTLKIADRLKNGGLPALLEARIDDLDLVGYEHSGRVKAPVAV